MGYIGDEIEEAVRVTNSTVVKLESYEANRLRAQAILRFAAGVRSYPLWEHITPSISVQDPTSWRWISDFVQDSEVIMFFNEEDDDTVFVFENGSQVVPVLMECTGFEFYLMDRLANYLICFNHHDFLIVAGSAASWLTKRLHMIQRQRGLG